MEQTLNSDLKCDVCGEPAIGVASSCMPISFAYCRKCLQEGAEPIFVFAYHYDEVSDDGGNLADWFTQNVKSYMDGHYISWGEYVAWRHANGQTKSQPCEPSDEEMAEWAELDKKSGIEELFQDVLPDDLENITDWEK